MTTFLSRPLVHFAAVVVVVAFAGCSTFDSREGESGGRTVATVLGVVTVPREIESVVVIEGRRDLDIVLSLGLPLVGHPYDEEGSLDLPSPLEEPLAAASDAGAEGLFLADEIDVEAIAVAAPSVIISRAEDVEPLLDELSAIAPVVAIGDQDTSTWQEDLALVAEATGTQARAAELVAAYDARVADIATRYATQLAETTIAPVGIDSEGSQVRPSRLLSTALRDVGATPSAAFQQAIDTGEGVEYGPEQLVAGFGDAEAVIALVNEPDVWASTQTSPLWLQLPAVAEGNVVRSDKRTHEGAALTAMWSLDVIEDLLQTL
ncbi:ABC transporter substrate-binding protein [Clavibacter zhangzhiyongii]|uniref:ABC transporter substrate-binding protein n=1 Tax=Clavibacter zhangzhiyongii TaxID=2768071 RepID=A0A7L7YYU4_9MICO|nr:ABC transporter substrate-binding protein [Clavibacter zhangzhiyongii]